MKKSKRTSLNEKFRIKMKWAAVSLIAVFAAIAQTQMFAMDGMSDGFPYGSLYRDSPTLVLQPLSASNPPPPRVQPRVPEPPECKGKSDEEIACLIDELRQQNDRLERQNEDSRRVLGDLTDKRSRLKATSDQVQRGIGPLIQQLDAVGG
jgi:hypothetical protein